MDQTNKILNKKFSELTVRDGAIITLFVAGSMFTRNVLASVTTEVIRKLTKEIKKKNDEAVKKA